MTNLILQRVSWPSRALYLFASAFIIGCGVYLHDDNLQKRTDGALSTYKTADVVGAFKTALDAQTQLDKAELQAVLDKENADRERALADLISAYPVKRNPKDLAFAINRLSFRIDERIKELVGKRLTADGRFVPEDWLDLREKTLDVNTVSDDLQRQLISLQRAYANAGGKDFKSCDSFSPPEGLSEELHAAAQHLKDECDIVALANEPSQKLQAPIDEVLSSNGEIAGVHSQLVGVAVQIDNENKTKNDALKKLQDAEDLVNDSTKDPKATSTAVNDQLKNLSNVLKEVDSATGLLGNKTFSLGTALAAIQFRKTNLQEVLAASGSSSNNSSGTNKTSAASNTNRAIVGLIAGLIEITDTSNPPSTAALSVALAYQDGLEKTLQTQLDALNTQKSLFKDEEDSLVRELEFLATAKVADQLAVGPFTSRFCRPLGFSDGFPNAHCSSGSAAAARALVAYNLSWASGRTTARLDDRKITQQITWEKLSSAQQAAIARTNIQTTALTEVAAFGQGGIKPETIAAFLQAAGVAAAAFGVNN